MKVELSWDSHEYDDFLNAWKEPAVKKTLGAAASAYGRTMKPLIKAETPVGPSGNKYATKGNLQRSVRYKRIRSSLGIGVVVGPMNKKSKGITAFYRAMVTGGTKAHLILPKAIGGRLKVLGGFAQAVHHPGAKANDFIGRVNDSPGWQAAENVVFDGLEARKVAETTDDL